MRVFRIQNSLIRWLVWLVAGFVLAIACLVTSIRIDALPPIDVLEYQIGISPKPVLGKATLHLKGWAWHPVKVTLSDPKAPPNVTFVQFVPFNPVSRHTTFFYRPEAISDEFISQRKQYAWGEARFADPKVWPQPTNNRYAWLPAYKLFVAAGSEQDLLDVLSILSITDGASD